MTWRNAETRKREKPCNEVEIGFRVSAFPRFRVVA